MKKVYLEDLPELVLQLTRRIDSLEQFIRNNLTPVPAPLPKFFDVKGLQNYLEEQTGKKPATQTVYGWIANRKVPFTKFGKELRFEVTKIEEWLSNGRKMNYLKED